MRLVTLLQRRLTRSCSWCVHSVSARSRLRNMLESSLTRSQPSIGRGRNSDLQLIIKTRNGKVRFANPWKEGMNHHDFDPARQERARLMLNSLVNEKPF